MLRQAVEYLICPVCRASLTLAHDTVRCPAGHSFDVSRHGYVSLLGGGDRPGSADTAAMIEARERFLHRGHYASMAGALTALGEHLTGNMTGGGCIVDVGGGTGYHLAAMLGRVSEREGIVVDISKYAARRATRAHPRIAAVVADAWQPLPIRDQSAALVLNVFAPRNAAEFHRVLRSDGALIVVTPTAGHLRELVTALDLLSVDQDKQARLHDQLDAHFAPVETQTHAHPLRLSADDIDAVVAMGPSSHHTDAAALRDGIKRLPTPFAVTLSMTVSVYQKRL